MAANFSVGGRATLITIMYVNRYDKIDHSQFFMKFAFWVWIDAEFTVELNGQRAML